MDSTSSLPGADAATCWQPAEGYGMDGMPAVVGPPHAAEPAVTALTAVVLEQHQLSVLPPELACAQSGANT